MSNENTQPVELNAEQTDETSGGIFGIDDSVVALAAGAVWVVSNYNDIRNGIVDGIWDANHPN